MSASGQGDGELALGVLAGQGLEGLVGLGQGVAGLDGHRQGAVGQQPGQALQMLSADKGADVGAARALTGRADAGGDPAAVTDHGRMRVQRLGVGGDQVDQGVDPVGVAPADGGEDVGVAVQHLGGPRPPR